MHGVVFVQVGSMTIGSMARANTSTSLGKLETARSASTCPSTGVKELELAIGSEVLAFVKSTEVSIAKL